MRTEQTDMVSIGRSLLPWSDCLSALGPEDLSRKVTLERRGRPRGRMFAKREKLRREGSTSVLETLHPLSVGLAAGFVNTVLPMLGKTVARRS